MASVWLANPTLEDAMFCFRLSVYQERREDERRSVTSRGLASGMRDLQSAPQCPLFYAGVVAALHCTHEIPWDVPALLETRWGRVARHEIDALVSERYFQPRG